tara:strand:+ start:19787 stop:20401 length:615 start_codon:yes stop_codon:yes gene_type:complete
MESKSKISNLKHIDHGKYIIDKIQYINFNLKNPNVQEKEYIRDDSVAVENERLSYIQLLYNNNPMIYITTPKMFCPFGFNKNANTMNLQFTNLETDAHMKSFFEFIQNIEFQQMAHIGLTEENADLYKTQIQYDKKGVYDPSLYVKLPFNYNKYEVDIYNDRFPITILGIQKYMTMTCDIYIDKIWKYNDTYICKWKVRNIFVH